MTVSPEMHYSVRGFNSNENGSDILQKTCHWFSSSFAQLLVANDVVITVIRGNAKRD